MPTLILYRWRVWDLLAWWYRKYSREQTADDRQVYQLTKPCVPRCTQPDLDSAVGADEKPPVSINGVQPAAHVFDPGAEAGESVRLEIDIAELDGAGAGRAHKAVTLPVDPAIADRAFGVVPNDESGTHRRSFQSSQSRSER